MTRKARSAHLPGLAPMIVNPFASLPRSGQALAVAVVFLWEWWFHTPVTTLAMVFSCLSLLFQVGMAVFPVPCCLLTLSVFVSSCLTGEMSGPSQLLAVGLAIGTLSFDLDIRIVLVLSPLVLGAMVYQSLFKPVQTLHAAHNDLPVLIFLFYLVVFFGYTSRQRAEYMDSKLRQEKTAALLRRVEVARLVHDSVTGDLSNIARVAQRQARLTDSQEEREAWRSVNERTIRVLDSVHAVIRQLSDGDADSVDGTHDDGSEGFMPALRARVDQNIASLAEAGFHGQARVIDHARYSRVFDPQDIAQRNGCVLRLVDEVFANIMRHGRPGLDAYQVTITCEKRQIEVVSLNPIATPSGDHDDMATDLPGGDGLRFHRAEIERLGGVLSADCEDGEWVLYARVPRRQPDDGGEAR